MLAFEFVRLRLPDFFRPATIGPEGARPDTRVTRKGVLSALRYKRTRRRDIRSLTKDTPHASAVYLLTYCHKSAEH